jgi:hypothetical protein
MSRFPVAVLFVAMACLARPAHASGPYIVDDADIVDRDAMQVEAWWSIARGQRILNIVPAGHFGGVPGVEWSLALNGTRLAGADQDSAAIQAKWQLAAPGQMRPGLALVHNLAFRLGDAAPVAASGFVAATLPVGRRLSLHANAGRAIDLADPADSGWAGGARAEWAIRPDRIALHAESFASEATGRGWQIGVRPTLGRRGKVDLELVAGGNLAGERARWITLGTAVRL